MTKGTTYGKPKLRKKKGIERERPRTVHTKYAHLLEEMFAAYMMGKQIKEIADIFNVPFTTLYTIRDDFKWDQRRDQVNSMVARKMDDKLASDKLELIEKTSELVVKSINGLLAASNKKDYEYKISDYTNLVKTYLLLIGEATEITRQTSGNDKSLLKEIVEELSPEERARVIDITQKIEQRIAEEQEKKRKSVEEIKKKFK